MTELIARARSLPYAYHLALAYLYEDGVNTPCPDWNTNQKECAMTMVVHEPLAEPMISKLFIGGPRELEQYRMEMLDGILDFEVERGNWHYTYHARMAEQLPMVIDELRRNPYSRRAVIQIRDWREDMPSEDPACLQHIQYFIREGKLDCVVLFRSNDACKATFMNAFALIMLQKRIADELGVEVGTYTHRANSFHCYEKDYPMLDGYYKRVAIDPFDDDYDLAYDYVGDWADMMEEFRPEILADIEQIRNH